MTVTAADVVAPVPVGVPGGHQRPRVGVPERVEQLAGSGAGSRGDVRRDRSRIGWWCSATMTGPSVLGPPRPCRPTIGATVPQSVPAGWCRPARSARRRGRRLRRPRPDGARWPAAPATGSTSPVLDPLVVAGQDVDREREASRARRRRPPSGPASLRSTRSPLTIRCSAPQSPASVGPRRQAPHGVGHLGVRDLDDGVEEARGVASRCARRSRWRCRQQFFAGRRRRVRAAGAARSVRRCPSPRDLDRVLGARAARPSSSAAPGPPSAHRPQTRRRSAPRPGRDRAPTTSPGASRCPRRTPRAAQAAGVGRCPGRRGGTSRAVGVGQPDEASGAPRDAAAPGVRRVRDDAVAGLPARSATETRIRSRCWAIELRRLGHRVVGEELDDRRRPRRDR